MCLCSPKDLDNFLSKLPWSVVRGFLKFMFILKTSDSLMALR